MRVTSPKLVLTHQCKPDSVHSRQVPYEPIRLGVETTADALCLGQVSTTTLPGHKTKANFRGTQRAVPSKGLLHQTKSGPSMQELQTVNGEETATDFCVKILTFATLVLGHSGFSPFVQHLLYEIPP